MEDNRKKTPWHLWVIGIVTLVWNAFGANDYLQSQTGNREYLASMTGTYDITVDQMLAYIDGFPLWADAAWALGVWGAVAGSVLLLLRSRFATWAFAIAIGGLFATTIYQFSGAMPEQLRGGGQMAFAAVIWIVTLALLWYAARMNRQGVLR